MPISGEVALDLLATMWRIRSFEERVAALKRTVQVHGLIHLSIGGEGVAAGVCRQLRDDDAVYSGHRAHGHAIARGASLERIMAELMGRVDGCCRGLGGSMHLVDRDHGFMGATGVVGGNLPLALGTALAARVRDSDQVTVVFFGDGAVQAGHFSKTVNLAALWELPLIFVCENNGFAEFTPRSAHTVVERVSDVVAAVRVRAAHRRRERPGRRSSSLCAWARSDTRSFRTSRRAWCATSRTSTSCWSAWPARESRTFS
jgi:pyruvate dehydrogenase E1 component alpha subunit